MLEQSAVDFIGALSSNAPVPGGGGASATVGALAAALGMMVTNLTIGKKKYADYEEELIRCRSELEGLRDRLITLTDKDAEAFEPLSRAYSLPKDAPDYERIMEEALLTASLAPLEIMDTALECAHVLEVLVEKGSRLAISDVGVGIYFAQAAIEGASLNVYINTKMMKDRTRADALNDRADAIIREGAALKEKISAATLAAIR
ncbi:MAG: cyclodeaminase/cyclohydrolase family protein [Peptococcaceae bacterium]|nr:cyclodeaminase/cyclohydrolase family protein [Peptococcaceae bacterium]